MQTVLRKKESGVESGGSLPSRVVAVNGSSQLCRCAVPVGGCLEGDVGGRVMHHRECAHLQRLKTVSKA
jgi:hypothetical protein